MRIAGYWASISVGNHFLDEYAPVTSGDHRRVTSYVNSEAGREFEIKCGVDHGNWNEAIEFRLFADGRLISVGIGPPSRCSNVYSISEMPVSETEDRAFEFADYDAKPVEEMDVDDEMGEDSDPFRFDRGRITLELQRVVIQNFSVGAREFSPDVPGLSTVKLGRTIMTEDDKEMYFHTDYLEEEAFAIFQWQHRDRSFLERYQFIPSSSNIPMTPPPDVAILPQFEQLSMTARAVSMSDLASRLSGMGVGNALGVGYR